uniref:non-specific serine/threonine protein kinase n=1 Tax=Lactuca sativa TaxID=4236 RepID=A0A9R1XJP1_LACSA|nr:hypothetical protein LSAT_V11C300147920 [Lactuca sativa]
MEFITFINHHLHLLQNLLHNKIHLLGLKNTLLRYEKYSKGIYEIITGVGHFSAIDWWAVGILLYEMLYGCTPFRGKNSQKTFADAVESPLCPEYLTS